LSATKKAITNLISWFSVYDFTKTVKQAGDRIFSCASICQKSAQYGIILQSYYTNKKGAIFMPHIDDVENVVSSEGTCNELIMFVSKYA